LARLNKHRNVDVRPIRNCSLVMKLILPLACLCNPS
jgi:hypothetical protein